MELMNWRFAGLLLPSEVTDLEVHQQGTRFQRLDSIDFIQTPRPNQATGVALEVENHPVSAYRAAGSASSNREILSRLQIGAVKNSELVPSGKKRAQGDSGPTRPLYPGGTRSARVFDCEFKL